MGDSIQNQLEERWTVKRLSLRPGLSYTPSVEQLAQASQARPNMVDGQCSSYLTTELVWRTKYEYAGYQDRRQEEQGILPDDGVGRRRIDSQLTAGTYEEHNCSRCLNNGVQQES